VIRKGENMSVYGIGNVTTPQTNATASSSSLNVEDFLKLMTAQLQNLDPMGENSTDSSEYISQMSQFTMLEQLSNLTESLSNLSVLSQQQISFSLVGKTATVNDGEKDITGVVEKVRYRNGYAYPVINGTEYSMDQVSEVGEE
jgi:flagellar basal-body rod modification protein FlgD